MSKSQSRVTDLLVFRVAELFFRGDLTANQIAGQVSTEFAHHAPLSRESIYPLRPKARTRGLVRLLAPIDETLTQQISEAFAIHRDRIRVVDTQDIRSNELVAVAAADMAL